jgi:hypothetical protein
VSGYSCHGTLDPLYSRPQTREGLVKKPHCTPARAPSYCRAGKLAILEMAIDASDTPDIAASVKKKKSAKLPQKLVYNDDSESPEEKLAKHHVTDNRMLRRSPSLELEDWPSR